MIVHRKSSIVLYISILSDTQTPCLHFINAVRHPVSKTPTPTLLIRQLPPPCPTPAKTVIKPPVYPTAINRRPSNAKNLPKWEISKVQLAYLGRFIEGVVCCKVRRGRKSAFCSDRQGWWVAYLGRLEFRDRFLTRLLWWIILAHSCSSMVSSPIHA